MNNFSARYERHSIETIKTSPDRMEPEWKRKKKAKAYRKIYLLYGSDGALGPAWYGKYPRSGNRYFTHKLTSFTFITFFLKDRISQQMLDFIHLHCDPSTLDNIRRKKSRCRSRDYCEERGRDYNTETYLFPLIHGS